MIKFIFAFTTDPKYLDSNDIPILHYLYKDQEDHDQYTLKLYSQFEHFSLPEYANQENLSELFKWEI